MVLGCIPHSGLQAPASLSTPHTHLWSWSFRRKKGLASNSGRTDNDHEKKMREGPQTEQRSPKTSASQLCIRALGSASLAISSG
jgi:hypothetical protein